MGKPPFGRGAGERIGPEIGDDPGTIRRALPLARRIFRPWRDAVNGKAVDKISLARARMDQNPPAGLEDLAPRLGVDFGHILLTPALRRDAGKARLERPSDDLVRALPDREGRSLGRMIRQGQAQDET